MHISLANSTAGPVSPHLLRRLLPRAWGGCQQGASPVSPVKLVLALHHPCAVLWRCCTSLQVMSGRQATSHHPLDCQKPFFVFIAPEWPPCVPAASALTMLPPPLQVIFRQEVMSRTLFTS